MRIGIITFHWGANHGAIMQTYASVYYLKNKLNIDDVKVINYCPKKLQINLLNVLKPHKPRVVLAKMLAYSKNNKLSSFRNRLPVTESFVSNEALKKANLDFDIVFCGSDQIWNPSFSMQGEGKPTPTYFLDFCGKKTKRVALSVSFGCTKYPENAAAFVKPYVNEFDAISVREKSGMAILSDMGIYDAVLTADPTAIISRGAYLALCESVPTKEDPFIGVCMLRKPFNRIKRILKDCGNKVVNIENTSMEEWLAGIRDAKFILTNSFHCVMMCLKMHTPFAFIKENGSGAGMNDRLYTMLEKFDMTDCIFGLENFDYDISSSRSFDWDRVDKNMVDYSKTLESFLNKVVLDTCI